MTLEEARALVLAKYPDAGCVERCGHSYVTTYTITVNGSPWMSRWLSGKHRSRLAAWLRAARIVRRESKEIG